MRRVHRVQSQVPQNGPVPTPARCIPADVVDLTDDSLLEAPIVAPNLVNNIVSDQSAVPERQVAEEVEAAPAPRVKSSSAAWKKGSTHLNKQLNTQGGSDAWRLFESIKATSLKEQKHRYCQDHWPTEEAAYDDILQMSR